MQQQRSTFALALLLTTISCNYYGCSAFTARSAPRIVGFTPSCVKKTNSYFQASSSSSSLTTAFLASTGNDFGDTSSSSPPNDDNDNAVEKKELSPEEVGEKRRDFLVGTRDPFFWIRISIWSLLGLCGVAGVVTSVIASKGIGQSMGNIAINVVFSAAMVGAIIAENKLAQQGTQLIQDEMDNPMLKGNSGFFLEKQEKKDET
mmetsp:Transcript_19433/g.29501  ORF Transcript_19433/g.29501 Transcript_19433/m.29501 type:complete len:204 (-) Transcript_19433:135-746(-)